MDRILGLDLGTKSLGIAISDSLGIAAHGYMNFTFPFCEFHLARKKVHEICEKENVKELALGLPLHMSGEMSERANSCLRFRDDLMKENPNLKITMIDERMTTIIANNRLLDANLSREKRKKVIDQQSAVVILESYMEGKKHGRY